MLCSDTAERARSDRLPPRTPHASAVSTTKGSGKYVSANRTYSGKTSMTRFPNTENKVSSSNVKKTSPRRKSRRDKPPERLGRNPAHEMIAGATTSVPTVFEVTHRPHAVAKDAPCPRVTIAAPSVAD